MSACESRSFAGKWCDRSAFAVITYGCKHEHIKTHSECEFHAAESLYCFLCFDSDGHKCDLIEFSREPIGVDA